VQCVAYPGPAGQSCEALVVQALNALEAAGTPHADCAVLLRHPWQSVAIENALLQADIAYATRGFTRYVLQPEVLLIRALLAVATGDYRPLASVATRRDLVRAVVFFCGIGTGLGHAASDRETPEDRLRFAVEAVAQHPESLAPFMRFQVLERAAPPLAARMRRAIDIAAAAHAGRAAPDWYGRFLGALDVRAWVRDVFVERQRRDDALHYFDGLERAAARFATPAAFFAGLGADETRLAPTVSGLKHAARAAAGRRKTVTVALAAEVKGLEFEQVLMPYLAQGIFPAALATDAREERNLFYVGITRARSGLMLFVDGERPSEFVSALRADN
jgi:DNA helicase-2/ATP-dependent DNA helicase PcrA